MTREQGFRRSTRSIGACHSLTCLLVTTGASAHVSLWAILINRPGGAMFMSALDAAAVSLALLFHVAAVAAPRRLTRFHANWHGDGFVAELIQAVIAAPLYVVWTLGAIPFVVRDVARDLRDPRT